MAFGERLNIARLAVPMELAELASRMEIPEEELAAYEADQKAPPMHAMLSASEALDIEMSFLMRTQPLVSVSHLPALNNLDEADRATIIARTLIWLSHYMDAETYLDQNDYIDFDFPVGFPVKVSSGREAAEAAERLRQVWQIAVHSTPLADALESKGIKVGFIRGVPGFTACAFWATVDDFMFPFIVVNADAPGHTQRYTIARELAYLMIDGITPQTAGHFAGAFLLPERHMQQEIGVSRSTLSFAEMDQIKQRYGVGIRHILVRALSLQLIEKDLYNAWIERAREWDSQEPGAVVPPEQSHRIQHLVLRLRAERRLNEEDSRRTLGMSSEQWQALTALNDQFKPVRM